MYCRYPFTLYFAPRLDGSKPRLIITGESHKFNES